jgi:cysteine desulfurase
MQVYLDNNATTRTDPAVVAAMLPYFSERFGNASSVHEMGGDVSAALHMARRQVMALLVGAQEQEIIFCSGGTEANNTAIHTAFGMQSGRDEIIVSTVEHAAILSPLAWLQKTHAIKVHHIPVDSHGRIDLDAYRAALGPCTALVSFMWANNETGTVFPVAELAAMAKEAGALFHTDAVQAAGKLPISLAGTQIDMLSLSGHKLHGPKGIGVLYVRKGVKFQPLIRGGHQERGRRAGTENVPAIVGLGEAAARAVLGLAGNAARMAALRDRLEAGLLAAVPGCRVNGDIENRLPNTSNIAFEDVDGEAVLHNLSRAGIAASSGSACTSGSMEPSHVLRAMRVPHNVLQGAVRFSLSDETSAEEIEHVLSVLPGIVAKVRENSPLWASRQKVVSFA